VNLDTLARRFEAGTEVTPELLRSSGVVREQRAPIKVLGRGEIATALTVRAHKFSGRAAEKIAAAGGTTEVVSSRGKAPWSTA
jgi:large subunit ribosomal protein L15